MPAGARPTTIAATDHSATSRMRWQRTTDTSIGDPNFIVTVGACLGLADRSGAPQSDPAFRPNPGLCPHLSNQPRNRLWGYVIIVRNDGGR